MIKIQLQALSNYEKKVSDEVRLFKVFEKFQKKYPRLFEAEEVVFDVRIDQNPHTFHKKLTVTSYVPKYGKVVAEAEERTLSQVISKIKMDLDRHFRKLLEQ